MITPFQLFTLFHLFFIYLKHNSKDTIFIFWLFCGLFLLAGQASFLFFFLRLHHFYLIYDASGLTTIRSWLSISIPFLLPYETDLAGEAVVGDGGSTNRSTIFSVSSVCVMVFVRLRRGHDCTCIGNSFLKRRVADVCIYLTYICL